MTTSIRELVYLREMPALADDASLISAVGRYGNPIRTYDDGYGKVYVHRDSMGISGIVRAQSWEDAYSICEDEFYPEASESIEDLEKEYGENWMEDACFQEAYGFRPNGPREGDEHKHGIYARDLNGDALDMLTAEWCKELGIWLNVEVAS